MRPLIVLLVAAGLAGCAEPPAEEPDTADETEGSAPSISFAKDTAAHRLTVLGAAEADWQDVRIRMDGCTGTLSAGMEHDLPSDGPVAPHSMEVRAGERLEFEGTGTCDILLYHEPTNTVYVTWELSF